MLTLEYRRKNAGNREQLNDVHKHVCKIVQRIIDRIFFVYQQNTNPMDDEAQKVQVQKKRKDS